MAVYAAVSWQDGDEITSTKLNQMAQNEQYCKDNLLFSGIGSSPMNGVYPYGWPATYYQPTRIETMVQWFDSGFATQYFDMVITIPAVFTGRWVPFFSIHDTFNNTNARITNVTSNSVAFRLWSEGLGSVRYSGNLYLMLIGT